MNERSSKPGGAAAAEPEPGKWFLEDFRVGQAWRTGERYLTASDIAAFATVSGDTHPLHTDDAYAATTRFGSPVAHGPMGIAIAMGLLHELHLVDDSVVALLETRWSYLAPMRAGDRLHAEVLITGVHRTSTGTTGVLERDVQLVDDQGVVVQRGSLPCMVRARSDDGRADDLTRAFCTPAWAGLLARALNDNAAFAAATATWDGTVGLACGDRSVQLRVYRGTILEAVRRTPHGPTFTLTAAPKVWVDLATGPGNDFIRRAHAGEITTSGDAYEYLRLTKAVGLLWDEVRSLAGIGVA